MLWLQKKNDQGFVDVIFDTGGFPFSFLRLSTANVPSYQNYYGATALATTNSEEYTHKMRQNFKAKEIRLWPGQQARRGGYSTHHAMPHCTFLHSLSQSLDHDDDMHLHKVGRVDKDKTVYCALVQSTHFMHIIKSLINFLFMVTSVNT